MVDLGAHIEIGSPIPIPAPSAAHMIPSEGQGIDEVPWYWYVVVVGRHPGVYFGPLSTFCLNIRCT